MKNRRWLWIILAVVLVLVILFLVLPLLIHPAGPPPPRGSIIPALW